MQEKFMKEALKEAKKAYEKLEIPVGAVIVKDGKKVLNEITPTDPETRQYVLLMKCIDNNTEFYQWESMEGRTETYNYIVDNIDILNIYPEESFVLTENVALKDALTIAEFVRYLKNSELVEEDGFNIEEYIY